MSRRKQAKPQHLTAGEEREQRGENSERVLSNKGRHEESGSDSRSGSDESYVCEVCCAEFLHWSELLEHQQKCTEEPPVLIVKEYEGFPPLQGSPAESFLSAHSDPGELETMDQESDSADKGEENGLPEEHCNVGADDPMDNNAPPDKLSNFGSRPPDSTDSTIPPALSSQSTNYGMPNTNVTLEILHSTRVAVAQFSQSIQGAGSGGKIISLAVPIILEQLMALQQQQVHQLQLIEQIRSQVAVMSKQPTQAALNPASKGLPPVSCTYHFQGIAPPPVLPLSGVMPSTVNGQASPSQKYLLEGPAFLSSQSPSKHPDLGNVISSVSLANPNPPISTYTGATSLLPSCNSALTSASHTQTLNSSGPVSVSQSVVTTSENLPLLPQSPPSGVIFPNPLVSIAATTNAIDPLAAMMKHRKGKVPNISLFETKPCSEDPFFKHKCRFCAKVFGSDSALQIHLRSHTGERPFKCNICGNRFSTKGNLKVHFQRHKHKYPHVQMNPYPVPEYLDNVPTSSGIPYGMSFPMEKAGLTELEVKSILPTLPTQVGIQLATTVTQVQNFSDTFNTPQRPSQTRNEDIAIKSDNRTDSPNKTLESLKPNQEARTTTISKGEEFHLTTHRVTTQAENSTAANQNAESKCRPLEIPAKENILESAEIISGLNSSSPQITEQIKARFPFGEVLESLQASETSKLQQLVENIDKKMMDSNQCVICHRVLSCQSALKMHYRIHTGERPYKCKVCGRAFTTKGNLKTHFGIHRAKPPLQVQHSCPICQKKFTNAVVLQQHIRMHMGGQIPNNLQTPQTDTIQEKDNDMAFENKSFDSINDYEDDYLSCDEEGDISENGEQLFNSLSGSASPNSPLFPDVSDAKTPSGNSTVSVKDLSEQKGRFLDDYRPHSTGTLEHQSSFMPESATIIQKTFTPTKCKPEGHCDIPCLINMSSHQQDWVTTVKCEMSESSMPNGTNRVMHHQLSRSSAKEPGTKQSPGKDPNNIWFPIKMEKESYNTPKEGTFPSFGSIQSLPTPSEAMISGMTSLLGGPPPRRTPKQHNCNACGKIFSSASALQIHERTHTGEKPFACSICGRAFTTKGNLKVHMGTHMWNNAPARRGRRLSVENPLALLGAEALKFNDVFQKDLATRAMNVDQNFWSRYAASITNGLAMKNNEISVIQNGVVSQLPTISTAMDKTSGGSSSPIRSIRKTSVDLGPGRHFSMLIDDNKEIRIN